MKLNELLPCSISNWYSSFKHVTFQSTIISLPTAFIDYLNADGCYFPKGYEFGLPHAHDVTENNWSDEEDENENDPERPQFSELEEKVNSSIAQLGGSVFPKLNWSSPKDATWMSCNGTLCCHNFGDICLLLKSSTFISYDLGKAISSCSDYVKSDPLPTSIVLVLRQWNQQVRPDCEFRCFVKNKKLFAISQRQHDQFYPSLCQQKSTILADIVQFFHENILLHFPLNNYVFDVFREKAGKIWLLDFNPFDNVTDSLLFQWDELLDDSIQMNIDNEPELRILQPNTIGIQPAIQRQFAVPDEFVNWSASTRDAVGINTSTKTTTTAQNDPFSVIAAIRQKQIDESSGSDSD